MESSMWLILLIIAVPVLMVLNDKYKWSDKAVGTPPVAKKENTFKAPSAQKLMKFTKKELLEFDLKKKILVKPSKLKLILLSKSEKTRYTGHN